MRYLFTILAVTLLASCSWSWPWQWGRDSGNCLDDNSCDEANPFEEELVGGTWYCYGKAKDEPWDCSQAADDSRIVAVNSDDDTHGEPAATGYVFEESPEPAQTVTSRQQSDTGIFRYPDDSFAVQLIALQTLQEVDEFAGRYGINDPQFVRIETQGDTWYVVLLDVFGNKAEADIAADNWNDTHQPFSKPWVRPTGPLKDAARRAASSGG